MVSQFNFIVMMCLKSAYAILLLVIFIPVQVDCKKYRNKDGKLVLNPVELVDLIIEEKVKTGPSNYKRTDDIKNVLGVEVETTTEMECRDGETLKARKVWSRWSKWGACSVTCGAGSVARARVCLAGRCAPGEREEQRRQCSRAPCAADDAGTVDDFRDVD